jgi:hypothetical protein
MYFSSTMTGASGPATSMLRAILRICFFECVRALAGFREMLAIGQSP